MKPTDTREIKSAEEVWEKHFKGWIMAGQIKRHTLPAMQEYAAQFIRLTLKIASEKAVADVSQNSTTNYCIVKPESILNLESGILKLIK